MNNQAREAALNNVKESIDLGARLPSPVFVGQWAQFLFLDCYALFRPTFANLVRSVLRSETSQCCCVLNLSSLRASTFAPPDVFYFAADTTETEYAQCLRQSRTGWVVMMDDYACASDVGDWCIYCEKANDVAVIGFRSGKASVLLHGELQELRAESIETLLARGQTAPIPFSRLTPTWRDGLVANYSAKTR
jgi:hypothetical protein